MSDLTYQELGSSPELTKRLEYVKRIKQDIALNELVIENLGRSSLEIDEAQVARLKALNMDMKDRLSEFDIYKQKGMYHCWRCKELDCVCELIQ